MGSTVQLDRTVKGVEDLLIKSLQDHLSFKKFTVFGVVCVTCEDSEDSSLTIKLNKEILKDVTAEKEPDFSTKVNVEVPLPSAKSAFRKRSFSADGNLPKIRTPQVRRLQPNRPSSAGVLLDDSPNRPSAFYKPTTPGAKKYQLPTSPLLHDSMLDKQDSFDAAFKAVTTDKGQRELLEKTLKEFIKIKYHQSVTGKDSRISPPPNPKISPMTTDFLKLLSLQARIMGVPLPAGLDSSSKSELVSPGNTTRDTKGNTDSNSSVKDKGRDRQSKSVAVDSFSKESSMSGALGITKHKKLSFAGSDKYRVEQGQFAKVMHDKLAGVKKFVQEEKDIDKKTTSTKATSPTRPDKRSSVKSDKRKQVLKKQHALRVAKELKHEQPIGDSKKLSKDLPSVPQVEIKDEKVDEGYNMDDNSSVLSDFNENCLIKGAADISEMDIKCELEPTDKDISICFDVKERYGTINDGNNSVHLPPSAYVFKPIIISPEDGTDKKTKPSKAGEADLDESVEGESSCGHQCMDEMEQEDEGSNQSSLSCTCDISNAEHSFVPRESLSSLQVEDEEVDNNDDRKAEDDEEQVWKVLPFADVESIPDVMQLNDAKVKQKKTRPAPVYKNRSREKAGFQPISEDSNTSNISMESVGFDIQTGYSPSKMSETSLEDAKLQASKAMTERQNGTENATVQPLSITPSKNCQQISSQGFRAITKTSLDDLAMSLSKFSPVRPDARVVGKVSRLEHCQDVSPTRKDSAVSNAESGVAQTSTPKVSKHASRKGFDDHNYTYKNKQTTAGKVTKDLIRKRKPQKTKKYFPLIAYLAEGKKAVGNIETEVVNMDNINVVRIDVQQQESARPVVKTSKKRQISGSSSKASMATPSKRIRCEEDPGRPKSNTARGYVTSSKVVPTKQGAKTTKPSTITSASTGKKPPVSSVRPPFRSVSNETIVKQNKKADLLIHKQSVSLKGQATSKVPTTPTKAASTVSNVRATVKKNLKKCEKNAKKVPSSLENKQATNKDNVVSNPGQQKASSSNNVTGSKKTISDIESENCVKFHLSKETIVEHEQLETTGVPSDNTETVSLKSCTLQESGVETPVSKGKTMLSPSIIVSLPIEEIFHCNKLHLVSGSTFQQCGVTEPESSPSSQVGQAPCEPLIESAEASESKRAKSVSPKQNSETNVSDDKERAKSVSPYCVSGQTGPKINFNKSLSAEDLSSLKEIQVSSCTDGVGHLLVRPIPTQYSSPRVHRRKAMKSKGLSQLTDRGRIDLLTSEMNLIVGDNVSGLMSATNVISKSNQENILTSAITNTPPSIKRLKHKHSSSKKRRSKSVQNTSSGSSARHMSALSGLSLSDSQSPPSGGSPEIKCLQTNSSMNQGKGRAGKKRAESGGGHTEGFKMKTHWLEMYGPTSPFSKTAPPAIADNKENY